MLSKEIIQIITASAEVSSEGAKIAFLTKELQQNPNLLKERGKATGRTLLHFVCDLVCEQTSQEPLKLLEFLLEQGADPSAKNVKDETALHCACRRGNIKSAKRLIECRPALINETNSVGDTPLVLAAGAQHFPLIDYLSAVPSCRDIANRKGETAATILKEARCADGATYAEIREYFKKRSKLTELCLPLLAAKNQVIDICRGAGEEKEKAEQLRKIYLEHGKKFGGRRNTLLQLIIAVGDSKVTLAFLDASKEVQDEERLSKQFAVTTLAEPPATKEEIYLFLGGGNLSFELSFAQKHPGLARKMVVTTYEDENTAESKGCLENKIILQVLGVKVMHSIDAKTFNTVGADKSDIHPFFKGKRLSRIYFSHPLAKVERGNVRKETTALLGELFASAQKLQQPGDMIIIPRRRNNATEAAKTNGYYKGLYGFHIFTQNQEFTYRLNRKHKFDKSSHPGYSHVTSASGASSPYQEGGSIEYVFQKQDVHSGYYSGQETDSDSDTEASELVMELERRSRAQQTALHVAVAFGDLSVVSKLLALGAILDTIDGQGRTALHNAIDLADEQKGLQMADLLIRAGANPNFRSVVTTVPSPLAYAQQKNKAKILTLFQSPNHMSGELVTAQGVASSSSSSGSSDVLVKDAVKKPPKSELVRRELKFSDDASGYDSDSGESEREDDSESDVEALLPGVKGIAIGDEASSSSTTPKIDEKVGGGKTLQTSSSGLGISATLFRRAGSTLGGGDEGEEVDKKVEYPVPRSLCSLIPTER